MHARMPASLMQIETNSLTNIIQLFLLLHQHFFLYNKSGIVYMSSRTSIAHILTFRMPLCVVLDFLN